MDAAVVICIICTIPCKHTAHIHIYTLRFCGLIQTHYFSVHTVPGVQSRTLRFMFTGVHTLFYQLAPRSLGLLHGYTCSSNKLDGISLQSLMDLRGGVSSPSARTRRRRHNAWSIAGATYLHWDRKRTMKLFSHPSWLAAFIRPLLNDPFRDMMCFKIKMFALLCVHKTEGRSCVITAATATEAGGFANLCIYYLIWNESHSLLVAGTGANIKAKWTNR